MSLAVQRQQKILEILDAHGVQRTSDLERALGVSPATVRRDLDALAGRRLIERTHGGAMARNHAALQLVAEEPPFAVKTARLREEKERIATRALEFVRPGATIILDSGSTMLALASKLAGMRVTIIVLDLPCAQAAAVGDTEVLVVGGRVRNGLFSVVGPWTNESLAGMHADLFFLGADAVDDEGVTNTTVDEAAAKRLAVRAASEVVLLADHTKFGRRALATVCRLQDLTAVITDAGIGRRFSALRRKARLVISV